MTDPVIKQNRKKVDPSMTDLLNLYKKEILLNLNCHHVATIQSFDSSKQTVTATINYKKTYFEASATGEYVPVLKSYPILLDVPIVSLSGGAAGVTMPIQAGDECLILFNDRDIDNWFQTGQVKGNATSRLHSISDGFALIGVRSLNNVLASYDANRAVLFNGTTKVAVGSSKVEIANQTTTLNTLLGSLIDAINAITTTNAIPGSPSAISATSQVALNAIKTQIAGLLE